MTRCVQDDKREYVNVPHTVHSREEGRGEFKFNIFVPLPLTFGDLSKDKADNSEESTKQSCQHEELEAVDDSFVVETTSRRHCGQNSTFHADVAEYFPNHVAQEEEVNSSRNSSQDDESHL